MGCRLAQGFYFAMPTDAESLPLPCSGKEAKAACESIVAASFEDAIKSP
jgi:EAL domain-containing protein (putative c-di-GMP-specific phosphodiesterase class I)